jgi:hypothetical protein
MSDNNKVADTINHLDRDLWNEVRDAAYEAQEEIKDALDLDYEDEMECNYPEPTSNQVISQCEKRKSSLTDDERFMIYTMYEHGIKRDLTFNNFCDKYYGYDDDDNDQYDDEYILSLQEQKTINNIDSSK